MPSFTTACPRNCYSTCAMTVHVEGGRLRKIDAHPGNLATSTGPCLKGLSYVERVYSPDRLLHPMRRHARSGTFERITLGRGARRDRRTPLQLSSRAAKRPVLHRQRHEGADEPRQHAVLAALRRLHHDLRRSLLAGGARGDAPHARREQAQRAVGPRQRAAHRALGQEPGRDEHPPDGVRRSRARRRRHARRHRSATHRIRRACLAPDPAASGDRRRPRARGRAPADRVGQHRPRLHRAARARVRRLCQRCRIVDAGAGRRDHGRAGRIHQAPRRTLRDPARHDLRRVRPPALHQRRPDDARDDGAPGDHGEHRAAGRRLDLREPPEPRLRRGARSGRLLPAGAP